MKVLSPRTLLRDSFPRIVSVIKLKISVSEEPPWFQANRDVVGHPKCGRRKPSRMRMSDLVYVPLFCHHRIQKCIIPFEIQLSLKFCYRDETVTQLSFVQLLRESRGIRSYPLFSVYLKPHMSPSSLIKQILEIL